MKKRLLSLIMAVMMVVVLVVPAAAATTDTTSDGTVTVYVTYGMFTEGGYDTAKKAPAKQAYLPVSLYPWIHLMEYPYQRVSALPPAAENQGHYQQAYRSDQTKRPPQT